MRALRTAAILASAALGGAAPAPAAPSVEQRAYQAGLDAYVYGQPPIIHALTQATFPVNQLVGLAVLQDASSKLIVLPNVDTTYTVGKLDLRAEPIVIRVPALAGRYYVLQFMDAYTNVIGYIGTRTTGTAAGDYAIVGPGWKGTLPPGVHRIDSPTADVLMLGRTLVRGPEDLPDVRAILGTFASAPLSTIAAGGTPSPSVVLDSQPVRTPPVVPTGLAFLDALGERLAADPPPAADAPLLRRLEEFGIGSGLKTSAAPLGATVRAGLLRGLRAGPARVTALAERLARRLRRRHHGWELPPARTGRPGTDYDLRAVVAKVGLWANTPAEAVYPIADTDSAGRALSGAHRYRLRFPAGRLPPARAFWSLTMYDGAYHLVANRLERYALGDRSGLVRDRDGGVTIYLQHAPPRGHEANWLPAPAGRFVLSLRLYWPRPSVLSGRWDPPPLRRVS